MKNFEAPMEIRAYLEGLKEKENRSKLICVIIAATLVIAALVVGIVYFIKRKDDDFYDDWDDDWKDEDYDCCCGDECFCTDSDVDKSVKVEPFEG